VNIKTRSLGEVSARDGEARASQRLLVFKTKPRLNNVVVGVVVGLWFGLWFGLGAEKKAKKKLKDQKPEKQKGR
jgi:hypothetical protein